MSLLKLIESKRDVILKLAESHGAEHVRLFGSVTRGDEQPDSDIDFLVCFQRGRGLLDRIGLMQDLEDLLGRKIDVVTENGLHWYIRNTVMNEAKPL